MAGAGAPPVRFEDVMVHFSREEFGMLEKWQQQLYFDVLTENCESLVFVGNPVTISDVISWFQRREQQNCPESRDSRAGASSPTDGEFGQRYSNLYTETLEPPKIVDSRSEEETDLYGSLEGTSEDLHAPSMHQGSPRREECMPRLEKATEGLASPALSQDAAGAPKPYQCQECGDRFRLKGLLRIHQMVTTQKPARPCPVCGTCFPDGQQLKKHQRIHRCASVDSARAKCPNKRQGIQAEKLHFCADCGKSFRRYLSFLQHQKSHEEEKVWLCAQCDAAFWYRSDLAMHEESHLEEASCVSSACGENCNCRFSFLLHFASQPEKSAESGGTDPQGDENLPWEDESRWEKPYSCHQCGEQFRLEENLGKHYRYCYKERVEKHSRRVAPSHQEDGDKRVRDSPVPKASRNRPSPLSQRSSARWACSHCGKSFTSRYCLFKHRQVHRAEECQSPAEPDKSVSPASGLGGHAVVGITKKLHKCQECRKSFGFKGQLVTHMKAHAKEGRCRYASRGESPDRQDHLGKHLQIQPGEREPCSGREEDIRAPPVATEPRKQGEEELCSCAECGKSYKKSYFPDHQAWHAGVRFMCLLCGNLASFKSGSSRHLQQHRKERNFTCPKCGEGSRSKSCLCLIEKVYLGQKPLPSLYK